jgi:ATP-binding cassette, subfamily B, bacterial
MQPSYNEYLSFFARYVGSFRWQVGLLAALILSSIGAQLVSPQIVREFLDEARAGMNQALLVHTAIIFIVVALIQQALTVLATYVAEQLGWAATNALREELTAHCLSLDQGFHKARTPGEMIERIDGDVGLLENFFSRFVLEILGNGVLVIGVLIALFVVAWQVGLTIAIFTIVAFGLLFRVRRWAQGAWRRVREVSTHYYGFVGETLAGLEDIRALGASGFVTRRTAEIFRDWVFARVNAMTFWSLAFGASLVVFGVADALAILLSGALHSSGQISLGTAYAIFAYTVLLAIPINRIQRQLQDLQQVDANLVRVRSLLETPSKLPDGPGIPIPDGALKVEVRAVSFAYDGAKERVLEEVSVLIEPGIVLGVLGRTGSGKTTFARLLSRLYDPQSGEIQLGGLDVRRAKLVELRARVGVVTQDVQLFSASIRNNLTFFDSSISDARLWAALETLELDNWCHAKKGGLDAHIEAGSLSAGEAQLLAFARVFLKNPGLVILDEASSRLDPSTEALLERAIDRLLVGRTAILIAHRLSTLERSDEILVLEHGRILEYDTRVRLATNPNSRFAQLLRAGYDAGLEEALA